MAVDKEGHCKTKGAYVKELSELDYDLPIVNKAIVERLTNGVPVEATINGCNDLKEFQKIVKVSSKYAYGTHNGKKLTDKVFRVFASNNPSDGYIGKCKTDGAKAEKFANTPDSCFIENDLVNGVKVDKRLNKQWYIDLAKRRLFEKFGVEAF